MQPTTSSYLPSLYSEAVQQEKRDGGGHGHLQGVFLFLDQKLEQSVMAVDQFMQRLGPRTSYCMKVVLTLPLLYLSHFWLILSPASEYRLLELLLIVLRYFMLLFIFGVWFGQQKKENTARLCIDLAISMAALGCMDVCYQMFQAEAHGLASQTNWWWTKTFLCLVVQLLYIWYFSEVVHMRKEMGKWTPGVLCISLIPFLFCASNILTSYMAPLYYYFSKLTGSVYIFTVLHYGYSVDHLDIENIAGIGKLLLRDNQILFGMTYYFSRVAYHVISEWSFADINLDFLAGSLGAWCTSLVVLFTIGTYFSILSNFLVAGSHLFLMGELSVDTIVAAFDANIGHRASLEFTVLSVQAGIMTCAFEERTENMKMVLFLSFYIIVFQVWDVTEPFFHNIVDSGERVGWFTYVRVVVFSLFIAALPTLITVHIARVYYLDLWMMLNATGCLIVLSRIPIAFLEFTLVSITWSFERDLDQLENAIYYVRRFKSLSTGIFGLVLGYYRFMAPFLDSHWIVRVVCLCAHTHYLFSNVLYREWTNYRNRQTYIQRVDTLRNATEEELLRHDDVCSVCLSDMQEGKILSCGHIFHVLCLRKWFQVRTTCPVCSQDALQPYIDHKGEGHNERSHERGERSVE